MQNRPAAVVTLAYLALTLPLALAGYARGPGGTAFLLGHLACVALMVAAWRSRSGRWDAAFDWAPLLLIPFLYAELPFLMGVVGDGYHDLLVQRWEAALFGSSPAQTLSEAMPSRWVSEPVHLAYLSYYALIYAPPLVLAVRGERRHFADMCAAVMLCFTLCFAVFIVFPVQGPRYLWDAVHVPDGLVRGTVVAVLEGGSSRGAAFPSSHVAVAVVQSVLAWRYRVPGAWLVTLLTLGLAVGAVYGGFHYAVDAVAGALVGLAVAALAPRLVKGLQPRLGAAR